VFVGDYESVAPERGATAELRDGDEVIGTVLRTRDKVKPVFVSVGHRCRLDDATALVLRCATGYRLPEPTRRAHLLVNQVRRGESEPCDTGSANSGPR
jgi:deoxyribonuclease V